MMESVGTEMYASAPNVSHVSSPATGVVLGVVVGLVLADVVPVVDPVVDGDDVPVAVGVEVGTVLLAS